jgi:hypothetical protein
MSYRRTFGLPGVMLICLCWPLGYSLAQDAGQPETVMVTLHAKPGGEAELERVIARHWATAQKMKLVRDTPHVTLRGTEENNNVYFVEIFTWRDARVPDAAPAEIRNIWNEMNRLVEARGGHPGLDLVPVSLLSR